MDMVWFPVFIIAAYILHPLFAVVALVTGALVGGLTVLTTKVTTFPLQEASKADLMATQRANAAFQNYEASTAWDAHPDATSLVWPPRGGRWAGRSCR